MGVGLLVGMDVMNAVHRHPASGRILEAADPENGEAMLHPRRRLETAVREEPVVADRDPLPEDMDPDHHRPESDPGKELREEGEQRQQVDGEDRAGIDPVDRVRPHSRGDVEVGRRRGKRSHEERTPDNAERSGQGWPGRAKGRSHDSRLPPTRRLTEALPRAKIRFLARPRTNSCRLRRPCRRHLASDTRISSLSLRMKTLRSAYAGGHHTTPRPNADWVVSRRWARSISS